MKRLGTRKVMTAVIKAEEKNIVNKRARILHSKSPMLSASFIAALDDTITVRDLNTFQNEMDSTSLCSVLKSNVTYRR